MRNPEVGGVLGNGGGPQGQAQAQPIIVKFKTQKEGTNQMIDNTMTIN